MLRKVLIITSLSLALSFLCSACATTVRHGRTVVRVRPVKRPVAVVHVTPRPPRVVHIVHRR